MNKLNKTIEKQYGFVLFVIIGMIIVTTLLLFANCIYGVVDDSTISMIASGVYGWEYSHCLIYGNAILGWIIKILNKVYQANYFMILQYILLVISSSLFSSIIVSKTNNMKFGIISLLGLWLIFYIDLFVHITYTTTAGYISLIGLLGITIFYDKSKTLSAISLMIALFGFMYRYQGFLLITPFWAIYLVLTKKKDIFNFDRMKKMLIYYVILFACLMTCVGINKYTYRSNEWQEYLKTNDLRTKLQDYKTVIVSEDNSIGLNKIDYAMFYAMKNDNPNVFGSKNLSKIVNSSERVTKSLSEVLDGIKAFYTTTFPHYQTITLLMMCFISILCGKDTLIKSVIINILGVLISAYWLYQGRYPSPVSTIVQFSMVITIILFAIKEDIKINNKIFIIMSVVSILLLQIKILSNSKVSSDNKFSMIDEIKKDNTHTYVLDLSTNIDFFNNYRPINKIPDDLMNNFVAIGGWISQSPLSKNICNKNGADNALDILGKRDDVFYVTLENYDSSSIVEMYLQNHYDKTITKELVQNLGGGFIVYRFNRAK